MFANTFLKSLFDMRKSIFWWIIVYVPLTLWMVVLYPSFDDFIQMDFLESMPPSLQVFLGGDVTLTTIEGFLTLELFSVFYPVMLLVALLSFSGGLICQEEDVGTLDLVLAHPIQRWRFLLEKVLALIVFTGIVLAAIFVGLWLGAVLAQQILDLGNTALALVDMGALALLFGALTLMLSGFGLGRGAAIGVGGGLAAITYLLDGLVPVVGLPEIAQKISPWFYYDGGATLIDGQNWGYLLVLVGVALIFLLLALIAFERRDVGV